MMALVVVKAVDLTALVERVSLAATLMEIEATQTMKKSVIAKTRPSALANETASETSTSMPSVSGACREAWRHAQQARRSGRRP